MIKLCFLGGAEEIGRSMLYIEYNKSAIIVDCGMQFADNLSHLGVQKIVPYGSYIKNNLKKIKGLFITHLHEDHVGGLRRFLEKYNMPIYAEELICEYLKEKNKFKDNITFIPMKNNTVIDLESFSIRPFSVEHSALNALGLEIKTKYGTIVHTGDFKLGNSEEDAIANLKKWKVKKNPFLLIAESTNSNEEGYSSHESDIYGNIEELLKSRKDELLVISTFASNMYRLKNIIELAQTHSDNIFIMGKNMEFAVKFLINKNIISKSKIGFINDKSKNIPNTGIILSTGCQGEPNGGLYKILKILQDKEKKSVLFSSSVIPGNERNINSIKCQLVKSGFNVIDNSRLYHSSGHAKQEEFKCLLKVLRPKYFVPIHGDYIKQLANKNNAMLFDIEEKNIILPENNNLIFIKRDSYEVKMINDFLEYITNFGIVKEKFIDDKKVIASNGVINLILHGNKVSSSLVGIPCNCKISKLVNIFVSQLNSSHNKDITQEFITEEYNKYFLKELKNINNVPFVNIINIKSSQKSKRILNNKNNRKSKTKSDKKVLDNNGGITPDIDNK